MAKFFSRPKELVKRLSKENSFLKKLQPLLKGTEYFFYEFPGLATKSPFIRDFVSIKRWMILVVISLLPCIFVAIWNTGLQGWVYTSQDHSLMNEYVEASRSLKGYFSFVFKQNRPWVIFTKGAAAFLPMVAVSYIVGGFWEILFAVLRKKEIAEGFLVSGILYPLILPPTLPLWMVALGISLGIIIAKELFGGTGMNILNPALTCRCFLYFAFPAYMTGAVWVGTNAYETAQSVQTINKEAGFSQIDGYTQDSALAIYNITDAVKRIHIDAIASSQFDLPSQELLSRQFNKWKERENLSLSLSTLETHQLEKFMTTPLDQGGLGLTRDDFYQALRFTSLKYGQGLYSNTNFFFGNRIGSMGEVSILASLLGAIFLLITQIASWRIMLSFALGVVVSSILFEYGSKWIGPIEGLYNPARFDFPFYKHFLLGGLVFGLVFMATDPVSSPSMESAKWIYGLMIGSLVVIVRAINPAYPEAVMLAILFGNVFAPLFDYYAVRLYRKKRGKKLVI